MIAHGHGDVKYAHYALDLYSADSNHRIWSFARFLHDLEKPLAYRSSIAGSCKNNSKNRKRKN
jgi:hypothetical protein